MLDALAFDLLFWVSKYLSRHSWEATRTRTYISRKVGPSWLPFILFLVLHGDKSVYARDARDARTDSNDIHMHIIHFNCATPQTDRRYLVQMWFFILYPCIILPTPFLRRHFLDQFRPTYNQSTLEGHTSILLIGICTNLTKKPMNPITRNPTATAREISKNSTR